MWTKASALIVLIFLWLAPGAAVGQYSRADLARSYRTLNEVRRSAGLNLLKRNAILERSAMNHAGYLAVNRATGHFEKQGLPRYTGTTPKNRTDHVAYPHPTVSENVNQGSRDSGEAIDGLMSAIYHRLGFLDFDIDEVGAGIHNARLNEGRYVYNMGNSEAALTEFCKSPSPAALFQPPGKFFVLCSQKIRVRPGFYATLKNSLMRKNPRVVIWPPAGAVDVMPAFFEEQPDPLPDYQVSGYPLSIQFNPALVKKVKLISFRLFRHEGPQRDSRIDPAKSKEVGDTRILHQQSDPNREFSRLQFALFPLQRMEWNQHYQAMARFVVDGKPEKINWIFKTRDLKLPMYRIQGGGEVLPFKPGLEYAIYLPPTRRDPFLTPFTTRFERGITPSVVVIDKNTLRIKLAGKVCQSIEFQLPGRRSFKLRLAVADTTEEPRPPEVVYAPCGEHAADYRIAANGEILPVKPGIDYKIYVRPTARHPSIAELRWSAPANVKPKVTLENGNTLRVRVTGKICQTVRFELSGGRRFQLRLATRDTTRHPFPPSELYGSCGS